MRMWGVDPSRMCRQHLLGEHLEMHMFVGHINKGRSIGRYATGGLVDTSQIQARHDALAAELERRGYRHASPLAYIDRLAAGRIDARAAAAELRRRCPRCLVGY